LSSEPFATISATVRASRPVALDTFTSPTSAALAAPARMCTASLGIFVAGICVGGACVAGVCAAGVCPAGVCAASPALETSVTNSATNRFMDRIPSK
jgi:hypothetical protein